MRKGHASTEEDSSHHKSSTSLAKDAKQNYWTKGTKPNLSSEGTQKNANKNYPVKVQGKSARQKDKVKG